MQLRKSVKVPARYLEEIPSTTVPVPVQGPVTNISHLPDSQRPIFPTPFKDFNPELPPARFPTELNSPSCPNPGASSVERMMPPSSSHRPKRQKRTGDLPVGRWLSGKLGEWMKVDAQTYGQQMVEDMASSSEDEEQMNVRTTDDAKIVVSGLEDKASSHY